MNNGNPNPTKMSKIFEPKTFEVASSMFPFFALTTEIIVSGIEVAAAITVNAIIIGAIPNAWAKFIAESVKKNVNMPIIPISVKKIKSSFEKFICSVFFGLFFFLCSRV